MYIVYNNLPSPKGWIRVSPIGSTYDVVKAKTEKKEAQEGMKLCSPTTPEKSKSPSSPSTSKSTPASMPKPSPTTPVKSKSPSSPSTSKSAPASKPKPSPTTPVKSKSPSLPSTSKSVPASKPKPPVSPKGNTKDAIKAKIEENKNIPVVVNSNVHMEEVHQGRKSLPKRVVEVLRRLYSYRGTADINANNAKIPSIIVEEEEEENQIDPIQEEQNNFLKKMWRRNLFNHNFAWTDLAASVCGTAHKVVSSILNQQEILNLLVPVPMQVILEELGGATGIIAIALKKECKMCKNGLKLHFPMSLPCEHFFQIKCHHIYFEVNGQAKLRCPVQDCRYVVSEGTLKSFKNLIYETA